MIDQRVSKLLRDYYSVRTDTPTSVQKILGIKYNNLFHEVKYKYEKLFTLGPDNYKVEFDTLLDDIAEKEIVIIAILEELIEVSSKGK